MLMRLDSFGVTIEKSGEKRYVAYDKFIADVARNAKIVNNIDLLPYGTLCMSRGYKATQIAMQYPACKKLVQMFNGKEHYTLTIPVPNIIMITSFGNKQRQHHNDCKYSIFNTYIFATPEPITSYDEHLYFCPLGNIFPDGTVCWGEISIPTSSSSFNIMSLLYNTFLNSEFNDDLYVAVNDETLKHCSDLFKSIKDMEEFPTELLQRSEYTLHSFMIKN